MGRSCRWLSGLLCLVVANLGLGQEPCATWLLPSHHPHPVLAYAWAAPGELTKKDLEYLRQIVSDINANRDNQEQMAADLGQAKSIMDLVARWELEVNLRRHFPSLLKRDDELRQLGEALRVPEYQSLLVSHHVLFYLSFVEALLNKLQETGLTWSIVKIKAGKLELPALSYTWHPSDDLTPLREAQKRYPELATMANSLQTLQEAWQGWGVTDATEEVRLVYFDIDLANLVQAGRFDQELPIYQAANYGELIFMPWSVFLDPVESAPIMLHEIEHYLFGWRELSLQVPPEVAEAGGTLGPGLPPVLNFSEIDATLAQIETLQRMASKYEAAINENIELGRRANRNLHYVLDTMALWQDYFSRELKAILAGLQAGEIKLAVKLEVIRENLQKMASVQNPLVVRVKFSYISPTNQQPVEGTLHLLDQGPLVKQVTDQMGQSFSKVCQDAAFLERLAEAMKPILQARLRVQLEQVLQLDVQEAVALLKAKEEAAVADLELPRKAKKNSRKPKK